MNFAIDENQLISRISTRRNKYHYSTGSILPESIDSIIKGSIKPSEIQIIKAFSPSILWVSEFKEYFETESKKTWWKNWDDIETKEHTSKNWKDYFQEIDYSIRFAYDHLPTKDAIKEISKIWEQLEKTSELAAARSRLLVGKLPKPKLAPLPKWFVDQKPKLFEADEDEVAANPCTVSSAELLVRAALANVPQAKDLEAEIETGPMGRVIIDWCVPEGRLQWMVEALDIPWPSIKVYQISKSPAQNTTKVMESRILFNVYDVINSFHQFLSSL
jgi:hypothetical protein